MEEEKNNEEPMEFVKSEGEDNGDESDFLAGTELPKTTANFGIMSDSRSTLSSTAISRTDTPDDNSVYFGVKPSEEKEHDPEQVKHDIQARGILRPKLEVEGTELRSALFTAALSKDKTTANETTDMTDVTDRTNESYEKPATSASARPTILSFKRESDLTDTRPSSASSSTTVTAPAEEEKSLKREVSFHEPEQEELVKLGERESSFISRPGNPPIELSTTCTQTEWSWLKDIELYNEISSMKPDWVKEKKTRRESKSSAGSSKSSVKKRKKKKLIKQPSSPVATDKPTCEELKMTREVQEGSDAHSGLSSPSATHTKPRHSLDSHLPSVSKEDDMLFRPATVELSSGESDAEYDYYMDEESLIPSIGPPAILQYVKESQHPPLSNEEVEDKEALANSEFLKKSMFSGPCMFCKEEVLPFPTVNELEELPPEQLFCCPQYERFVKFELSQRGDKSHVRDELIDIKPHPPYGTKAARRAAKERAAERAREREMERQKAAGMNPTNFYALTRQMKTINYSLASTKCMEEGWTVRPRSPSPSIDGLGDDPFVIEVNPLQLQRQAFLERFYGNGARFLLLLPDGTGCCYYPSGNIAVMITSTESGKFNYLAFEDNDDFEKRHSGMLASFDPSGHGACYFRNGAVRLVLDPFGGVLLDSSGSRKKKWLWHNLKTHVHAPPFQPITFSITKQLSVRCLAQNKVVMTFNQGKHTARFNVGSKLKAVRNLRTPVERDEHEMHLAEVKQFINILLDRTQNALRLPNYPRLDKIPLPLRLQKNKDVMRRGKLRPIRPESKTDSATVTVN